jgi:gamma-glutamylcyclotransferase (GGCT)/AIG2-like uncharacterized protein YtfP
VIDLFVYGSLMRGEANHRLLAGAEALGAARTAAEFELVDLGPYPGLVAGGGSAVVGELYRVDGGIVVRLDAFEGHPGYFRRSPIRLVDGRPAEAYLLARRDARGRPRVPAVDRDSTGPVVRWRGGGRRS